MKVLIRWFKMKFCNKILKWLVDQQVTLYDMDDVYIDIQSMTMN